MMSRFRPRWGRRAHAPFGMPWLVSVAAGVVLLIGSWSAMARALIPQCLPVDGPIATFGLRMLLLRDVADCPQGTLAVAPGLPHGVMLAAGLVLPVLAAHAAVGALGFGLIAAACRGARGVVALLEAVLPAHGVPTQVVPMRTDVGLGIPVGDRTTALSAGTRGECHPLRAPPVGCAFA